MSNSEDAAEQDAESLKTSFSMKFQPETARWLRQAFPDSLGPQERLRAAVTELRVRRRREATEDLLREVDRDCAAALAEALDMGGSVEERTDGGEDRDGE